MSKDASVQDAAVSETFRSSAILLIRALVREEVRRFLRDVPDRLMALDEAAPLLAMTPAALRKAVQRGRVPVHRIGRSLRFRFADLLSMEPT